MDENQLPPPWFKDGKKNEGQNEATPKFNKYASSYWGRVGLPNFKTIIGTSFAWCGLAAAITLINTGHSIPKGAAGAKNWDKLGVAIEWKTNGIPQGAFVRLNHKGQCGSGSGNHITQADGYCTAADLLKSGATFNGYGGNQGNRWKVSTYSVKEICSVRWPSDYKFPSKVTKSVKCTTGKSGSESTR